MDNVAADFMYDPFEWWHLEEHETKIDNPPYLLLAPVFKKRDQVRNLTGWFDR